MPRERRDLFFWQENSCQSLSAEAWEAIRSDLSRPFSMPKTERSAIKIINHLGDEVMKVLKVG